MMSGTSCDGVDAALIETDGLNHIKPLDFCHIPYDKAFQKELIVCGQTNKASDVIVKKLTDYHLMALAKLGNDADAIGLHGHTIAHNPAAGITTQIIDAEKIAKITQKTVIYDFRSADVEAGGQGAPLVPVYHQAIAASCSISQPIVFINLGGVANITYCGQKLLAFDTGMASGLLDQYMQTLGQRFDLNGALAAQGMVDESLLEKWLQHPYFQQQPPKSLDRFAFDHLLSDVANLSSPNAAATLTAFTVYSLKMAEQFYLKQPKKYVLCGGGRYNKTLVKFLKDKLSAPVKPIEDIGYNGDAIEAQAFAYLAIRGIKKLPITFPETTGVREALCGGRKIILAD